MRTVNEWNGYEKYIQKEDEKAMRTPFDIAEGYVEEGAKKAAQKTMKTIVLGMMAGMFIAFGACTSSVGAHLVQNAGLAKVVAGCIFPVGLMMIVFIGGELFTGDCLMIMGCMRKKYNVLKLIEKLIVVFFSNLLGALIIVLLAYFCGQWELSANALGAYTIKVALGKANLPFVKALCSGILCNFIVCVAVLMGYAAKDVVGKVWGIFFPILAFVVGGFEHCVANMYYIPAGIFAARNEAYRQAATEMYGISEQAMANLDVAHMVSNLIPVTLGNIIGGMVLVALPLYYLHHENMKK